MFTAFATHWLADFFRIARGEFEKRLQGFGFQMRLVAKGYNPVRQLWIPGLPFCGALDGTEHSLFGRRVHDSIFGRVANPIQLSGERSGSGSANNGDLRRSQFSPILQQMPDDGGSPPRQQQLRLAHASRGTRRENDHAKFVVLRLHFAILSKAFTEASQ